MTQHERITEAVAARKDLKVAPGWRDCAYYIVTMDSSRKKVGAFRVESRGRAIYAQLNHRIFIAGPAGGPKNALTDFLGDIGTAR